MTQPQTAKKTAPKRVPIIPARAAPARSTAPKELKVRARLFKPEEAFATVHGDSIAEYFQNGYYFDHFGYVVHDVHASQPRVAVEELQEAHRDAQDELRQKAAEEAAKASEKLDALLADDADEVAPTVEMPEDGWDEPSVTKKFADRKGDVMKLKALTNRQINGYLKKLKITFNANNGTAAKWENIHALLTATAPNQEADADQSSEGGDGSAD